MISILGRTLVLLALAACSVGAVTGFVGGARKSADAARWSRWMAYVVMFSMIGAVGLMEYALLAPDFSIHYVAEVGSRSSPTWVRIVSLWSSLNGSILLWGLMLGLYLGSFAWFTRDRFREHAPWALGTAHIVGIFFTFLVAGIANPFSPMNPIPLDGPGPNPLLQNHILMVVHPPTLYIGYVGMTIPFAMGIAALLAGRIDAAWARALRMWTILPWGFLSIGIILGGWWSYEVLGWGGWWAWDPVENASFLPWLTTTAFLHSAVMMERRDQLKGWALGLLIASFLLTILGTFMTRSGVFNSVHSFTQSPIGPVFLGFLALAAVASLILLAARIDRLVPPPDGIPGPVSREIAFLVNNLLFTAFTFTVLVGTVWPLVNEALSDKQISVGQPYFDRMAIPIGLLIVFMMGVGPALPWGRTTFAEASKRLSLPLGLGIVVTAVCFAVGLRAPWSLATYGLSTFALVVTLRELADPALARMRAKGESLPVAAMAVFRKARRRYGGYIVHIGVLLIAVAQASAISYGTKDHATFVVDQPKRFGEYTLTFTGTSTEVLPSKTSQIAHFNVKKGDRDRGELAPRLNQYGRMAQPIGTPEVMSGLDEDLYLSLVNVDADTASLEMRLQPMVWWLWFGGGVIGFGTLVAAWPDRKRKKATASEAAKIPAAGAVKA